jgi:hypothetical protein
MPEIPSEIPKSLYAGDRWKWEQTIDGYSPTEYSLTFYFVQLAENGFTFNREATAESDPFSFDVDSESITGLVPGFYRWAAQAENETEKVTVLEGELEIKASPATATDVRTPEEKILDALEAAILGTATSTQLKYQIDTPEGSRMVEKMGSSDLLKLRDRYKSIVIRQRRARSGKESGTIFCEFRNP